MSGQAETTETHASGSADATYPFLSEYTGPHAIDKTTIAVAVSLDFPEKYHGSLQYNLNLLYCPFSTVTDPAEPVKPHLDQLFGEVRSKSGSWMKGLLEPIHCFWDHNGGMQLQCVRGVAADRDTMVAYASTHSVNFFAKHIADISDSPKSTQPRFIQVDEGQIQWLRSQSKSSTVDFKNLGSRTPDNVPTDIADTSQVHLAGTASALRAMLLQTLLADTSSHLAPVNFDSEGDGATVKDIKDISTTSSAPNRSIRRRPRHKKA